MMRPELVAELLEVAATGTSRARKREVMIALGLVAAAMAIRARLALPALPRASGVVLVDEVRAALGHRRALDR